MIGGGNAACAHLACTLVWDNIIMGLGHSLIEFIVLGNGQGSGDEQALEGQEGSGPWRQ